MTPPLGGRRRERKRVTDIKRRVQSAKMAEWARDPFGKPMPLPVIYGHRISRTHETTHPALELMRACNEACEVWLRGHENHRLDVREDPVSAACISDGAITLRALKCLKCDDAFNYTVEF